MSGRYIKSSISLLIAASTLTLMNSAIAADATSTTTTSTSSTATEAKPSQSESYLKDIRDVLTANIDKLPVYLNQITKMALSWLSPDDSKATSNLQMLFTRFTNAKTENSQTQTDSQPRLVSAFMPPPASKTPADLLYYNRNLESINYQTLSLPPGTSQTQDSSTFSYAVYAAGLNIRHPQPEVYWRDTPSVALYKNFYYTASASQTFNASVMSELYANSKNGNKIKQTQDALVRQASDSEWFTQIASENIGVVLRQILLFNSQTYVMLTQLLDTQQKLLTAQVMNNALLIAVNQEAENRMFTKAAGLRPD